MRRLALVLAAAGVAATAPVTFADRPERPVDRLAWLAASAWFNACLANDGATPRVEPEYARWIARDGRSTGATGCDGYAFAVDERVAVGDIGVVYARAPGRNAPADCLFAFSWSRGGWELDRVRC